MLWFYTRYLPLHPEIYSMNLQARCFAIFQPDLPRARAISATPSLFTASCAKGRKFTWARIEDRARRRGGRTEGRAKGLPHYKGKPKDAKIAAAQAFGSYCYTYSVLCKVQALHIPNCEYQKLMFDTFFFLYDPL